MKKNVLPVLATTLILLSACGQPAETSVSPDAASSAASAINAAASSVQTLSSKDSKLTIRTENGSFVDVSQDKSMTPPGADAESIVILQRDDARDITLYATNLGKPKKPASEYFAKLKQAIEADTNLKDIKVGIATENRMDYHYTQTSGDDTLNETCVSIYSDNGLYNVCAYSPTASMEELEAVLKDIKLNS